MFDDGPADAPAPDIPAPEPPAQENAPEQAAGEPPAQDAPAGAPGEVNVSADQIEKLMAERRAAERAEVEKNEPPEPEKPKGRRGRKPKEEKAEPGKPGGTGARCDRPAKADKAATDKPPSPPRDKMSQSKGGKTATVKEEIVYLNLSELFPFKDHPFGVRDDAEMKGLVESVKDNGVHQPALVRPREGGGYEIIAGQ